MNRVPLTMLEARAAIESLSAGIAPSPEISERISVGLDDDLQTFASEYFSKEEGLLPNTDQGVFKIVEAYYGGGKTHYLRVVERLAHRHGFASAFIELHKDSCPLTRFDLVYSQIVRKLKLPGDGSRPAAEGIEDVIRAWVSTHDDPEVDEIQHADDQLERLGGLPLASMRIALRDAAHAIASDDRATLDEALVYLESGKISRELRKRGVLEKIDARNGSLAIRSIAAWLRAIGVAGLVLVMDEGDRSLSIASSKDQQSASNNLVQLINETVSGTDWPGVMFLYSIPSWDDFQRMFSFNMALIQRVRNTGFPNLPPATRIVLDDRYDTYEEKVEFCVDLGERLYDIFSAAYPALSGQDAAEDARTLARSIAEVVIDQIMDVSFRRIFVHAFLAGLYHYKDERVLNPSEISRIVEGTSTAFAG